MNKNLLILTLSQIFSFTAAPVTVFLCGIIGSHISPIKSLSTLLEIDKELINLKGKTVEKLGLIGNEKAIACEAICSISE